MQAGDCVGQYRLISRVGGGSFGEVWKAEHTEGHWLGAVKLPRRREVADTLRKEGELSGKLKMLKHANIVEIYDLNTSGEPPHVVYEYVDGEDLACALRRGCLASPDILRIIKDVAAGLQAAHSAGIVHRDTKPSNILIGKDGIARIADFGLGGFAERESRLLSAGNAASMSISQVSGPPGNDTPIVGTLAYMAPEQRRGGEVTSAADLYSLGVVLYEALTGELPEGAFEKPSELVSSVPAQLDAVLLELLSRRPERRPTAAQLFNILAQLPNGTCVRRHIVSGGPEESSTEDKRTGLETQSRSKGIAYSFGRLCGWLLGLCYFTWTRAPWFAAAILGILFALVVSHYVTLPWKTP